MNSRMVLTAHQIENGFVLEIGSEPGAEAKVYYCETEADIGKRIIALAAENKMRSQHTSAAASATSAANAVLTGNQITQGWVDEFAPPTNKALLEKLYDAATKLNSHK